MPTITVIGSLNTDLVTLTPRIPEGGETLTATSFSSGCGGKGANQAVGAARISRVNPDAPADVKARYAKSTVTVRMVGAVGNDTFGETMLKSLAADEIDISGVRVVDDVSTGTATILVEEETGENRILVVPGANHVLKPEDNLVGDSGYGDVVLFQLEIQPDVVLHHLKLAKMAGAIVVFNPAPAVPLPESTWGSVDHLILNETEASIMGQHGLTNDADSVEGLGKLTQWFLERGTGTVTVTLGSKGAFSRSRQDFDQGKPGRLFPAEKVKVVDTTAAGDTFVGAYAVGLVSRRASTVTDDEHLDSIIAFAQKAAAKTVGKVGAQSAIPWLDEIS